MIRDPKYIVQQSFVHGNVDIFSANVAVCLNIEQYCNTHNLLINTISIDTLHGYKTTEKWGDSLDISPPQRQRLGIYMDGKYYLTVPLYSDIIITFSSYYRGVKKYNNVLPVIVKCNENGAVQLI